MINARLIAMLRKNFPLYLSQTADVYGTGSSGRTLIAAAIPCHIGEYAPGTQQGMREYNQDIVLYVLTTKYDQALKIDDEIVHNGYSYQVYELLEDKTPLVFRQARMRKMS